MIRVPYGEDFRAEFPLIDAGAQLFLQSAPTIAAGDGQIRARGPGNAFANLGVRSVAFTSGGTHEVLEGDTLTGATSAATAVVLEVVLTSGSWAAGTAAGTFWLKSQSGTFQSETLNEGANTNVATIAGDTTAGLFGFDGNGQGFAWILGTELQNEGVVLHVIDQTATQEWEDQAVHVATEGHPAAAFPFDGIATYDIPGGGTPTAVDATTFTLPATADGTNNKAYQALLVVESGKPTRLLPGTYVASTKVFTPDPAPGLTYTTACVVFPVVYPDIPTTNLQTVKVDEGTGTGQIDLSAGKLAWNAAWDAEVQSEVADALAAYGVATTTGAVGSVTGSVGSIATDGITADSLANDCLTGAEISAGFGNEIADAVLDEDVEGSYTLRQLVRLFAAALLGKASGLDTTSAAFRDLADSKPRITATVDADGNRSAVTLDAS